LSFATSVPAETSAALKAKDRQLHPDCPLSGVTLTLHLDQQSQNLANATLSKTPYAFHTVKIFLMHFTEETNQFSIGHSDCHQPHNGQAVF